MFISQMQETNMGHALDEDGVGGPYTIFVPSNEALNNMKDGALDYLLSSEVLYHCILLTLTVAWQHHCFSLCPYRLCLN